jgi:hypothetical protein
MPTAIIIAHNPEGFFIAADGRSLCNRHGVKTVFRDDEQKIFPIVNERACFAYAVTGTARLTSDNDDTDVVFDFNSAVSEAANDLKRVTCISSLDYFGRLAELVKESIQRSIADGRKAGKQVIVPNERDQFGDGMLARLFLCGYYSKLPYGAIVRFSHIDGNLEPPETLQRLAVGESSVSGSNVVGRLLQVDPRFARFRLAPNASLAQFARNYVAACESAEGLAEDPEICPSIGGHVHCAKITQDRGFEWLVPPKQGLVASSP